MPRIILIALIALIAFLIAGCASSPDKENVHASEWATIRMNQSGGIMGLSRSIKISANGKFMIADERADKKVKGELSSADLAALNEQISALKDSFSQPVDTMCADCFIYNLDIQGKGKDIRVQLNDVSLPNSGFEALVSYLRGLMDKDLQKNNFSDW